MRLSLLLCLLILPLNVKTHAQSSARLDSLTRNYEAELEKAKKPIRLRYIESLKKLRADLSSEGNQREALLVEHQLRELGELDHNLESFLLSRTWKYINRFNKSSRVVFKRDGTAEYTGSTNATYRWQLLDDSTLRIFLPNENHCDFVFPKLENQRFTGKTASTGAKRFLEPL